MLLFILLSLYGVAVPVLAQDRDEAALLQQLHDRAIQRDYVGPNPGQESALEIFRSIDRKRMPSAWIEAYFLLEKSEQRQVSESPKDLIAWAEKNGLQESMIRAIHAYLDVTEELNQAEVEALFQKTILESRKLGLKTLEGIGWLHLAYYYYSIDLIPEGIKAIEKSMAILKNSAESERIFYYHARSVMANFLAAQEKNPEALAISEENFQWLRQHAYALFAAKIAYNMAILKIGLLAKGTYQPEAIVRDLDYVQAVAQEQNNPHSHGLALYARGKLWNQTGSYATAAHDLKAAEAIFSAADERDYAALSKLHGAYALIQLKKFPAAEATLKEAEKLLTAEYQHEQLLLLERRRQLAEAQSDFPLAVQFQKKYYEKWEDQKTAQENKDMQKLSAMMGVKLVEERNLSLKLENDKQASRLRTAERMKTFLLAISALAVGVLALWVLTLRQRKNLALSEKKLRVFLDSIDEGLLTVDSRLGIGPERSSILSTLTDAEPADSLPALLAQLKAPTPLIQTMEATVTALMSHNQQEWTLQEQDLPREWLTADGKTFAVRWIPLFHGYSKKIDAILIIIRNISRKKALEKTLDEQRQKLKDLPLRLQELATVSLPQSLILVERSNRFLGELGNGPSPSLLRELHTRKGEARTLGLQNLSSAFHDLETALKNDEFTSATLEQVRHILSEYQSTAASLASSPTMQRGLFHAVGDKLPSWLQHMQKAEWPWLELHLVDEHVDWRNEDLQIVEDFLLHGVNNSLDHGFVIPLRQGRRVEKPIIEIKALRKHGLLRIQIEDNGVGLNWDKLQTLAQERGFVPPADGSVADLVFFDGVSTADQVTQTSGRGVGLAAVRESFENKRGRVRIESRSERKGTIIWGEWPYV